MRQRLYAEPGMNLSAVFRTSHKRWTSRPPASCWSARKAWDHHAKRGPILWMRLLDGYWGACRPDGDIDECENTFAANNRRVSR
jgi:hypothetical protein